MANTQTARAWDELYNALAKVEPNVAMDIATKVEALIDAKLEEMKAELETALHRDLSK